ncbi:FAD-dependent oxidoreductase [bacterium]|nr:FAD-dependent oxidoreductase [bacterium]
MTKQKRLYLPETEIFVETAKAKQVEKEVYFSTDQRDIGWIEDNIPCQWACPASTNIPGYIRPIFEERYGRSYEINRYSNLFPGILGRICSRPCEIKCRHGWEGNGDPVAICYLKRAASDLKSREHLISDKMFGVTGKKVAIVGSGPAGLSVAHDLAVFGHQVTLFEELPKPGGMLRYGIPIFRLPHDILEIEIDNILRLGIDLQTNVKIGKDIELQELIEKYDAVILAAGTLKPVFLNIHGKDLAGVYSGLEFMMKENSGEIIDVGEVVHVIGGGYTAMDCARTARRLGAERVLINILGTEDYLQIEKHELFEVKLEGVEIRGLVSIQAILGKEKVEAVRFKRNRLGGYMPNGERAGVPIEGSDFEEHADTVIFAIGQKPDYGFVGELIKKSKDGYLDVDENSFMTGQKGVFAAGDFMTGASTIIKAIGSGKHTAWKVDEYLLGKQRHKFVVKQEQAKIMRERKWDFIHRQKMQNLPFSERFSGDGLREVETGYNKDLAMEESKRCYLCYLKFEIDTSRCIYCGWCIDVAPKDCIKMAKGVKFESDGSYGGIEETKNWNEVAAIAIDNKECIRCGACLEICPVKCIDVVKVELIEEKVISS